MTGGETIPLDKFDMSIDISIGYREHILEYNIVVRNDSPYRIEPITIYPVIPPEVFTPDKESEVVGPLSGGESASVTFLLTPNEEFYNLVLAKGVVEGRDVEITTSIRSRQGMVTCDILLKNKKRMHLKGIEVTPLVPPGYASPIKSRIIDLAPLESKKVSFNLIPEKQFIAYEKKTARYVPFTPRYRRLTPPSPQDMPYRIEPELEHPHPYTRAQQYNPLAPCASKSIRRLVLLPEIKESLKIEETTPEEIEIRHIPKIKSEISEKASQVSRAASPPEQTGKPEPEPGPEKETPQPDQEKETSPQETTPEEKPDTPARSGETKTQPTYPCHYCGKKLTFIEQYRRWYCYNCKRYL